MELGLVLPGAVPRRLRRDAAGSAGRAQIGQPAGLGRGGASKCAAVALPGLAMGPGAARSHAVCTRRGRRRHERRCGDRREAPADSRGRRRSTPRGASAGSSAPGREASPPRPAGVPLAVHLTLAGAVGAVVIARAAGVLLAGPTPVGGTRIDARRSALGLRPTGPAATGARRPRVRRRRRGRRGRGLERDVPRRRPARQPGQGRGGLRAVRRVHGTGPAGEVEGGRGVRARAGGARRSGPGGGRPRVRRQRCGSRGACGGEDPVRSRKAHRTGRSLRPRHRHADYAADVNTDYAKIPPTCH